MWAVPLALGWSVAAEAQAPISVGVTSWPGHPNLFVNPLFTAADCDVDVTFRFVGLDTSRTQLYWYSGASCSPDPGGRVGSSCVELPVGPSPTDARSQIDIPVLVRDLLPCAGGGSGMEHVFVFAMNNPSDSVTGDGQATDFELPYDFSVPFGLMARGGADIALSWDPPAGDVARYEVYLDPGACGDAAAGGDAAVAVGDRVATVDGSATSDWLPFPSSVPVGARVGVALRAFDASGNPVAHSSSVCVTHLASGGCGCVVAPPRRSGGLGSGLIVLALGWSIRRRARARARRAASTEDRG